MTDTAEHPAADAKRFCKRCRYNITGITPPSPEHPHACPECGQDFHPDDPASFHARPGGSLLRYAVTRFAVALVCALAIVYTLTHNLIPLPTTITNHGRYNDWRMWTFQHRNYGTAEDSIQGHPVTITLRADKVTAVTKATPVLDSDGAVVGSSTAWAVRRVDHDTWSVTVNDTNADWSGLLASWNATRDRRFGLLYDGAPSPLDAPFAVTASEHDTLTAMARAFKIDFLTAYPDDPETQLLWVWDRKHQRVRPVPADLAFLFNGYDPRDSADPRHPQNRLQSPNPDLRSTIPLTAPPDIAPPDIVP